MSGLSEGGDLASARAACVQCREVSSLCCSVTVTERPCPTRWPPCCLRWAGRAGPTPWASSPRACGREGGRSGPGRVPWLWAHMVVPVLVGLFRSSDSSWL